MKHAVGGPGLNWPAIKTGIIATALVFSFAMGFQFKDNIDHPRVADAAVNTTVPKAPAQP